MSKQQTFTFLVLLCFVLLIVCGAFTSFARTAFAATDVRTQFTESVMRLNRSLGDESPAAFIPLLNERSGMALLLRFDADKCSSLGNFDKKSLASLLLTLITDNSYLAVDVNEEMQYIVNKDNSPVFDLQPIFDLLTGSLEDVFAAVTQNVVDGSYQQFDIGDNVFADEQQQQQYANDLGFLFSQTTLYYFGSAERSIAVNFYFTMAGSRQAMLNLSDIAFAANKYFTITNLHIEYKEINLSTQSLSSDVYFAASVESRDNPECVAMFATLVAWITENEEFKQELVNGVNSYLQSGEISVLKSSIDKVSAAEGMKAMETFSETSYDEILQTLGISSQQLKDVAQKNKPLVSFLKVFTDRIVMSNGESNFESYQTTEGSYYFNIDKADEDGNRMVVSFTANLFEPAIKDLARLRTQISLARQLNKDDYTEETWAILTEILQEAELATEEFTQSQIDALAYRLEKAIKNLTAVPPIQPEPIDLTWLYITLPTVVVLVAVALIVLSALKRHKQFVDNTPVVEYDLDDDIFDDESDLDEAFFDDLDDDLDFDEADYQTTATEAEQDSTNNMAQADNTNNSLKNNSSSNEDDKK